MNILFMCVANSARSQLAEGLAKNIFPNAKIESAGSQPGKLNPFAVKAMKEIGIDISQHYSKSVDNISKDFISNLDYVITLCAEEVCPTVISKAKKLHWPFPDPASKDPLSDADLTKRFEQARNSIRDRLELFKKDLQAQVD